MTDPGPTDEQYATLVDRAARRLPADEGELLRAGARRRDEQLRELQQQLDQVERDVMATTPPHTARLNAARKDS